MKGYVPIPTGWTRDSRNEENRMFQELFTGVEGIEGSFEGSLNHALLALSQTNSELMGKFRVGDNLFDKNGTLLPKTSVSSSGDIYVPNENNVSTVYRINVKPNSIYYATGIFWYLIFDREDNIVQSGNVSYRSPLNTVNNGYSMIISIRTTALDAFMLAESSTPISSADYVPYTVSLEDMTVEEVVQARSEQKGSVFKSLKGRLVDIQTDVDNSSFKIGKNLINRLDVVMNTDLDGVGGTIPSDTNATTKIIRIKPSTSYSTTGILTFVTFDEDMFPSRQGVIDGNAMFTTLPTERYVMLSPRMTHLARIMFAESEVSIHADRDYIPYEICYESEPLNLTDPEAEQVFIQAMNDKAKDLGMSDTVYTNSSGLSSGGEGQVSTVKDTMTMLKHALKYKELTSMWGDPLYSVKFGGPNPRSITIASTVSNPIIEDTYTLLGGKSGTILNPSEYHLITLVTSGVDIYAVVVLSASTTSDRFTATKQLLDFADKGTPLTQANFKAKSGGIVKLKNNQTLFKDKDHDFELSFLENTKYRPASTIKTMTAMILLDVVKDLNETFEIRQTDIVGGSGPTMSAGEVISFKDALYLLMLPSSNNTAKAIARVVGRKIAKSKTMR